MTINLGVKICIQRVAMRKKSVLETLITEIDSALRTIIPPEKRTARRCSPATGLEDYPLSFSAKKHMAGLMRVNHAGEVCAQALYQGQAFTAQLTQIKQQMQILIMIKKLLC